MTLLGALVAFAPLAALMTLTPGADMTLVLRTAARQGGRPAVVTGFGVSTGALLWAVAAAVGVAALLHAFPAAYRALSWAGAAYLLYLGVRLLWPTGGHDSETAAPRRGAAFLRGLTTNLLNPKIGVFYVSLIPQFPVVGVSPALVGVSLATLHGLMATTLFCGIAAAAQRVGDLLRRPRVARGLDLACGTCLVAFGVFVAWHA